MAEEKKTYKFVCVVCGYEVEVDTCARFAASVPISLSLSRSSSQTHGLYQRIALSKGLGRILGRGPFPPSPRDHGCCWPILSVVSPVDLLS